MKIHRQDWTNLVLLIALSLVPILAGMNRLARLAGSGTAPKGNLRFALAGLSCVTRVPVNTKGAAIHLRGAKPDQLQQRLVDAGPGDVSRKLRHCLDGLRTRCEKIET